ncbi:hypothetical protein J6590_057726 [Homalodisca vitripennis]|nr:hypothetical protein J6590_057726 [Homalodisca vitripennis]
MNKTIESSEGTLDSDSRVPGSRCLCHFTSQRLGLAVWTVSCISTSQSHSLDSVSLASVVFVTSHLNVSVSQSGSVPGSRCLCHFTSQRLGLAVWTMSLAAVVFVTSHLNVSVSQSGQCISGISCLCYFTSQRLGLAVWTVYLWHQLSLLLHISTSRSRSLAVSLAAVVFVTSHLNVSVSHLDNVPGSRCLCHFESQRLGLTVWTMSLAAAVFVTSHLNVSVSQSGQCPWQPLSLSLHISTSRSPSLDSVPGSRCLCHLASQRLSLTVWTVYLWHQLSLLLHISTSRSRSLAVSLAAVVFVTSHLNVSVLQSGQCPWQPLSLSLHISTSRSRSLAVSLAAVVCVTSHLNVSVSQSGQCPWQPLSVSLHISTSRSRSLAVSLAAVVCVTSHLNVSVSQSGQCPWQPLSLSLHISTSRCRSLDRHSCPLHSLYLPFQISKFLSHALDCDTRDLGRCCRFDFTSEVSDI